MRLPDRAVRSRRAGQQGPGRAVSRTGVEPDQLTIRLGREAVEQADKLGAAHHSDRGYQVLIVGDDVASQLAGDELKAQLKTCRAQRRREGELERPSDDDVP